MMISDRFLVAVKRFLEDRNGDLPEVRLRDWGEEFPAMCIVLDVEDEPVEDEEIFGQFEIAASAALRCQSSVDDAERRDMMAALEEVLNGEADGSGREEFDLVHWMRSAEDRGIPGEELGVFDLMVGGGSWEVTDEEVTGVIEFTALCVSADLGDESFGI